MCAFSSPTIFVLSQMCLELPGVDRICSGLGLAHRAERRVASTRELLDPATLPGPPARSVPSSRASVTRARISAFVPDTGIPRSWRKSRMRGFVRPMKDSTRKSLASTCVRVCSHTSSGVRDCRCRRAAIVGITLHQGLLGGDQTTAFRLFAHLVPTDCPEMAHERSPPTGVHPADELDAPPDLPLCVVRAVELVAGRQLSRVGKLSLQFRQILTTEHRDVHD